MTDWEIWVVLIVGAYLLGSVPMSFLVARARGIDLRKEGTRQVGGGNLWRTTSRKYGLAIGIWDFGKGMIMVAIAHALDLSVTQQVVVGMTVRDDKKIDIQASIPVVAENKFTIIIFQLLFCVTCYVD